MRLAGSDDREVVGGDILQEIQRMFAFYPELAHVADVEDADALTDNHVLLVDSRRVLDRHVETGEFRHLCAQRNVNVCKGSVF